MANVLVTGAMKFPHRKISNFKKEVNLPQYSEVEKSWLACAIDTDGCISFYHSSFEDKDGNHTWDGYRKYIVVVNTNLKFMKRISKLLHEPILVWQKKRKKCLYAVRVYQSLKIYHILRQIFSYLIIKKEKARKVMDFIEARYLI